MTSIKSQNNCLNFDGINDYVDCGSRLPQSYTKEAWIYITDISKVNNIVSGEPDSPHAFWVNGNRLSAGHNGVFDYVTDPNVLLANTWYHVAVTYETPNGTGGNNGTMKLYKNGVLVGTPNTGVQPINSNAHVYIGNYNNGFNVFAGNIDEVRMWNVARTATEIANNMNTSFSMPQTNLIANFRFNQGVAGGDNTGNFILVDDSAIHQNGDIRNFNLIGSTSNFITSMWSILPVELLNFNGKRIESTLYGSPSNLLTWQTANEINNKGFQVERLNISANRWDVLGFVPAQGKQASYEFTDNTPLPTSYYHLRQIDNDGKEVVSKTISVVHNGSNGLKIYPTIVSNNFLNIEVSSSSGNTEGSVFNIYNLLGQQVLNGKLKQQMDISVLPIGTYIIKVGTEQAKFIKQ